METMDMERVRRNQENISSVKYKQNALKATSIGVTPELERVRQNQENLSSKKYKCDAERLKGRYSLVSETPEMERVKANQQHISSVQYQRGLQEMRGRSCTELDTPEYRRVRKTQDSVSMAKYHEDFERARGRGSTPGLDDPSMERYHRANHMMGEAGYSKGMHPQAMEMDRRPGGIIVAPVLPGAYHHQGVQMQPQQQYHGYMHQTSMSSVRSVTSPPHSATMRVYRALYDYAAQDHDEVSFRDGDVIVNAQPIDEGWMYGTVQRTGKSGMLPANYVECCN
ncbi:LIM zinc-binding domain-containing Nebulette-like [Scomber scombrus]|uniref:LIM zinc-binding domain-containing Nebulette-like n=1 Tax=Scomber scombrus TaxID=13677 RepID=A0AAV1Q8T3_SCOSC